MTVEQLCEHSIRLIHAPIHVYAPDGAEIAVYADYGEQTDIMACDEGFRKSLLAKRCFEFPVLYLEANQMVYGIVSNSSKVYIIGPCCVKGDVSSAVQYLTKAHGLAEGSICRLHYLPLADFSEIVIMIYEMATGRSISFSDLLLKNFFDDNLDFSLRRKIHRIFYHNQENETVHNPYGQEKREQESIRKGDLEALKKSFQEAYVGKLGTLSRDSLRNAKNLGIVLVTLASRSAIEGGILSEIAFSMSDAYIQRIEEMKSEGEALALARQAEIDFCCLVRDTVVHKQQNPVIVKCKELVLQYLHTKISVGDLAEKLDVNANYLSQLFAKEEGMTLSDYIAREKINFAKRQLIYTDDSYESIAYSYAFFSQSHFGRVFKKMTGMTPGQYRARYGRQRK